VAFPSVCIQSPEFNQRERAGVGNWNGIKLY